MIENIIKIENLSKDFGKERILHNISREFEKGKIHGIVGNNGSGKTVLMKCICGFLSPTCGSVIMDEENIGKDIDFPKNLGIIIETPGFLPNLTGFKNLTILAELNGKISNEDIKTTLEKVGLDPNLKKPVRKYSLGMRQRLGIAQAIMENPKILILDEPFNGLDKNGVKEIYSLLKELKKDGKTIILASHHQSDIDNLCDTVCEMDAGHMTIIRENNIVSTQ